MNGLEMSLVTKLLGFLRRLLLLNGIYKMMYDVGNGFMKQLKLSMKILMPIIVGWGNMVFGMVQGRSIFDQNNFI
jgi:hypothetical protein